MPSSNPSSQDPPAEAQRVEPRTARGDSGATAEALDLLSRIGHDVRGPLTSILGFAELLSEGGEDAQERFESVRAIQRNGKYLLSLVNDVLDLSRLRVGRFECELGPARPFELIQEVVTLMRFRAERKGLVLHSHVDWPFPERIHSDGLRMRQILMNLVGNAVKYTDRGEISLRSRFENEDGEGSIHIQVEDSGPGIALEDRERVFEPFERGPGSDTVEGTGLGLAISQELARALGGELRLTSQPGVGSIFELIVPAGATAELSLVPREPVLVSASDTEEGASVPRLAGRVLLVEDQRDNRRLMSALLARSGLEVTLARNGIEALELLFPRRGRRRGERSESGPPPGFDLILMDVEMPFLGGVETTRELNQRGNAAPIVAVTAHTGGDLVDSMLELGCREVIHKPLDLAQLYRVLRRFLKTDDSGEAA